MSKENQARLDGSSTSHNTGNGRGGAASDSLASESDHRGKHVILMPLLRSEMHIIHIEVITSENSGPCSVNKDRNVCKNTLINTHNDFFLNTQ